MREGIYLVPNGRLREERLEIESSYFYWFTWFCNSGIYVGKYCSNSAIRYKFVCTDWYVENVGYEFWIATSIFNAWYYAFVDTLWVITCTRRFKNCIYEYDLLEVQFW